MRLDTERAPLKRRFKHAIGSHPIRAPLRAGLVFATVALALAACSSRRDPPGVMPVLRGFVGGVASDEPRAALAARETLAAGGTGADAAVAGYLVLTVTMPARVSLGGGGLCLVYDPRLNRVETLNFAPLRPAQGGPIAIPAGARGLAALQGRYGRLRFEQVVARAEAMARFGTPASRAAAADLAVALAAAPALDPALARLYRRRDGAPLAEGDPLGNPALADTLAAIRGRGAHEFHSGSVAREFVTGARAAGATFDEAEFAAVAPDFRAAATVTFDEFRIAFAPPPAASGTEAAQIWSMAAPAWKRADAEQRAHLLAEAAARAAWDRQRWFGSDQESNVPLGQLVSAGRTQSLLASYRPDAHTPTASYQPPPVAPATDAWTTSITAVDSDGGAATCIAGMGDPFGAGRASLGVILARSPDAGAHGLAGAGAVIATRPRAGQLVLAASGAGGFGVAPALAQVALAVLAEERPMEEAIDRARLAPLLDPDLLAVEPGSAARLAGLARRGWRLEERASVVRLHGVACFDGLVSEPGKCQVRADRRGAGLATGGLE